MRWDTLRLDSSATEHAPPLIERGAVTRTFDTPEFRGLTFYEVQAKSIVSRVPEASRVPFRWTINPYRGCSHSCVYCFARNSHTYLDLDSGHDFDTKIVVKGTLILRDLHLLQAAAEVTDVGLNVSAGFVDKSLWRAIEPGTPAPERRLEACATLNDAGLPCGVLMGPIVPFLSDSPAQLAAAVRQAAEAGATRISPIVLHLRTGSREWFLRWLGEAHPELVPRYAELYGRGAYVRRDYQARIAGQVRELAERFCAGRTAAVSPRVARGGRRAAEAGPPAVTVAPHEQLTLL
jgi:DNA repair photolyase